MLRLVAPTQRLVRMAALTLWALTRGGWRLLVWDNVRAGTIDLSGTPRSFRSLMRLGLWLTLLLLVGLLFGDAWRGVAGLQPLTFYTDALAGIYVPELFVPVVFGLLAVAWAFLLAGALHAPWPAKLIVLMLFGLFNYGLMITPFSLWLGDIGWVLSAGDLSLFRPWTTLAVLVHAGGWLFLLALFVARWRRPARPGLEFALMLGPAAAMLFAAHFAVQLGVTFQYSGAVGGLQLTVALEQIDTFLAPFLVIAGAEIAQTGLSLTQWLSTRLGQRASSLSAAGVRWWALGLGAFLLYRLAGQWLWPLFSGADAPFSWGALAIGCGLLAMAVRAPRGRSGALPGWVVPGVAVLLCAALFLLEAGALVSSTLGIGFILLGAGLTGQALIDSIWGAFNALAEWNEIIISAVVLLVALGLWWRARRKRQPLPPAAFFAFVFVTWVVWWLLTRPGRPLGALTFQYDEFAALTTVALAALLVGALVLRRLTARALLHLTAAAAVFWLLGSRAWLSDPLSPLFVLLGAQAAFISVSVFLNVMSAGNRFALSAENPAWPRVARGLLYFGYAALTVISMNWLAAGHQADALAQKDLLVQNGFIAVGLPLAIWSLVAGSEAVLGRGDWR